MNDERLRKSYNFSMSIIIVLYRQPNLNANEVISIYRNLERCKLIASILANEFYDNSYIEEYKLNEDEILKKLPNLYIKTNKRGGMIMKVFSYDIWDGDKGIIFAQNEEEAEKKFKDMYPDTEIATDFFESGECSIDYLCDYNGEEKLVYMYN